MGSLLCQRNPFVGRFPDLPATDGNGFPQALHPGRAGCVLLHRSPVPASRRKRRTCGLAGTLSGQVAPPALGEGIRLPVPAPFPLVRRVRPVGQIVRPENGGQSPGLAREMAVAEPSGTLSESGTIRESHGAEPPDTRAGALPGKECGWTERKFRLPVGASGRQPDSSCRPKRRGRSDLGRRPQQLATRGVLLPHGRGALSLLHAALCGKTPATVRLLFP